MSRLFDDPHRYKQSASLTLLFVVFTNWIAVSCSPAQLVDLKPTATTAPTSTSTLLPAPTPTSTATPVLPDSGWSLLQPGLERRIINVYDDQHQWVESFYIVRLDQRLFQLDVGYHETPQSLEDWQQETGAVIVTNGGYFRIENETYIPTGLTIVNGKTIGSSYDGFAGMVAIRQSGAELRWLMSKPYDPSEPLLAALQSFPVLVKPGSVLGFSAENEDNLRARRSVIAQDMNGNILLMVASKGFFTLHQLSVFLTKSDLNLDIAINLDGGPSSGILLDEPDDMVNSLLPLPIVILVYNR